jgi:hypothetical protein
MVSSRHRGGNDPTTGPLHMQRGRRKPIAPPPPPAPGPHVLPRTKVAPMQEGSARAGQRATVAALRASAVVRTGGAPVPVATSTAAAAATAATAAASAIASTSPAVTPPGAASTATTAASPSPLPLGLQRAAKQVPVRRPATTAATPTCACWVQAGGSAAAATTAAPASGWRGSGRRWAANKALGGRAERGRRVCT